MSSNAFTDELRKYREEIEANSTAQVAEYLAQEEERGNDARWLRKESTLVEVHKLFGQEVPELWTPIACPIRGLSKFMGAWIQADGGEFVFNLFHTDTDENVKKTMTLVEFYASQLTDRKVCLEAAGERGIWLTRMLADIGAIELPDIEYRPLGPEWSAAASRVHNGLVTLVKCHMHYDSSRPESCFSIDFGSVWCGVAANTFRQYRTQLQRAGYFEKTGEKVKGKTSLEADLYRLIPG